MGYTEKSSPLKFAASNRNNAYVFTQKNRKQLSLPRCSFFSYLLIHIPSFVSENCRALKGLEHEKVNGVSPVERPTSKGICVRHWVNPIKETIHSIDGAIGKHGY